MSMATFVALDMFITNQKIARHSNELSNAGKISMANEIKSKRLSRVIARVSSMLNAKKYFQMHHIEAALFKKPLISC